MPTIIDEHAPELAAAVTHLDQELKGLRSGRASAAMVESITVPAYGSAMELKGVASISIPDAKTIAIDPWDKALVKDIEKVLIEANLGMQPSVNGSLIRLSLPPMTEENRKQLVKRAHELTEDARIAVRNVRSRIRDLIQSQKEMGEDEQARLLEDLEKRVKDANTELEQVVTQKEEEIMTI